MANGNTGDDDDNDEASHHRCCHWSFRDISKFEGKDEQPFLHLIEFEEAIKYSQIIKTSPTSSKHHSKTMQGFGSECTLRKECQIYTQQMDGRQ